MHNNTIAPTPSLSNPILVRLAAAMADTYALCLKTQGYHWNVEGRTFYQLHTLFEVQYKEMIDAVDELAERIRALGGYAPSTFAMMRHMTSVEMDERILSSAQMVEHLVKAHTTVCESLRHALGMAREVNDPVSEDLLVERLRVHETQRWMLESLLQDSPSRADLPETVD